MSPVALRVDIVAQVKAPRGVLEPVESAPRCYGCIQGLVDRASGETPSGFETPCQTAVDADLRPNREEQLKGRFDQIKSALTGASRPSAAIRGSHLIALLFLIAAFGLYFAGAPAHTRLGRAGLPLTWRVADERTLCE